MAVAKNYVWDARSVWRRNAEGNIIVGAAAAIAGFTLYQWLALRRAHAEPASAGGLAALPALPQAPSTLPAPLTSFIAPPAAAPKAAKPAHAHTAAASAPAVSAPADEDLSPAESVSRDASRLADFIAREREELAHRNGSVGASDLWRLLDEIKTEAAAHAAEVGKQLLGSSAAEHDAANSTSTQSAPPTLPAPSTPLAPSTPPRADQPPPPRPLKAVASSQALPEPPVLY